MIHQARGNPHRKRTYSNNNGHDSIIILFFPKTISSFLLLVLLISTLLALYVGIGGHMHRTKQYNAAIKLDAVSLKVLSSSTIDDGKRNENIIISSPKNETSKRNYGSLPTIHSFKDLTSSELHPKAGPNRHIVTPPSDEGHPVTLVTCSTTAGYLHVSCYICSIFCLIYIDEYLLYKYLTSIIFYRF